MIWPAHHARLADRRMLVEGGFDFLWRDIAPAADDDLLLPSGEPIKAVSVTTRQISGMEPAVPDRRRCRIRILPIADHEVWASNAYLPHVTGFHFAAIRINQAERNPFPGLTNGTGSYITRAVPGCRGNLRHAIGFTNGPEVSLKGLLQCRRGAVSTREIESPRSHILRPLGLRLKQTVKNHREANRVGAAPPPIGFEDTTKVKWPGNDDRCTVEQTRQKHHGETNHVRHR